jgi:NADPH2:quinone reductase
MRIEAVGVNYIEVYQRTGVYRVPLPATPGTEAAGTLESVGDGVTAFKAGDRVVSTSVAGAYAEYAVVPADRLVRIPEGVTTRQAAAVLLQGMTAHYLTTSTFPLAPGDSCLVHAAAGGTGMLICQMARKRGATVIGTVSTDEKAVLALSAGAHEVIVYTRENFVERTRALTGGAGVRVVYDSVGRSTFLAGFDCLAPRGMMVLFGQSSGPAAPIDPYLLAQKGSLFLTRPAISHYIATPAELEARAREVLRWVADGSLSVRIGAEYPLARAADAHRALESRRTTGKVLLLP